MVHREELSVTPLRQRVLDELQRRNYSPTTARAYVLAIKQFAVGFHSRRIALAPALRRTVVKNRGRGRRAVILLIRVHPLCLNCGFRPSLRSHTALPYSYAVPRSIHGFRAETRCLILQFRCPRHTQPRNQRLNVTSVPEYIRKEECIRDDQNHSCGSP